MAPRAHILLVDDDAGLRGVLGGWLRSRSHVVTEAADGSIALAALASGCGASLIILDLEMPVMDGRTFLVTKARGDHAAIPVIIFSSSSASGLETLPDVIAVVPKCEGLGALMAVLPASEGGRHVV
jgi:CheY-like chemotaxis protein